MFTVPAFKLIRRNCPEDLDKLLKLLEVDKKPNWDRDDEFKIAQELDRRIDKKLCALLDSNSDIDGYAKLLERGAVKFSFSETRKELLEKILANRDKILLASLVYTQGLYIKITCNRAESFTDRIESSWQSKSIVPLIAPKEEINLSRIAQQKIKHIIAEEYNLSDCDEIVISIIEKKSSSSRKTFPTFKLDARTFEVLEQIDKIFNKI